MKKLRLPFTFIGVALFASGCANTGTSTASKVSKAPPPDSVSFAVRQFTSPDYSKLNSADKGVRDFEHIVLPAQLVKNLRGTGGVKNAWFTSGPTAAADFVVDGSIMKSDGRTLEVEIKATRVDGAQVYKNKFWVTQTSGDVGAIRGKLAGMFQESSRQLVAAARKTNISLPQARTLAYAEQPLLPLHAEVVSDAEEAARIEGEDILDPLTNELLPRADIAMQSYEQWQSVSTPLMIEKAQAQARKNMATFGAIMGVAAGAASFNSGMDFARAGNAQGVQMAQSNIQQAGMLVAQNATNAEVAENQVQGLAATLNSFKNDFTIGKTRQVTVKVYDRVIKLSGDQASMLAEFRAVVKEQLNKRAFAVPPESATLAAN